MTKLFTFAVSKVETHNQRELGNHAETDKTVTVEVPEQFIVSHGTQHYDAAATENIARNLARTELAKLSPGIQKYHPAELNGVEEFDNKQEPEPTPAPAPVPPSVN